MLIRPRTRRSKANFASPSLGRGRALMPAPPFPTNLLLRKIFAGALCHSKNNKCQVWYVCPAGTNRVPQRKSVVLLAEVIYKKGLPQKSRSEFCGKRSSEHRSKAARNEAACEICSAATKRRGTLLGSVILEARQTSISLAPPPGVPKKRRSIFLGWVWGSCRAKRD